MGTDEDASGVASGVGVGLGEGVARVLPLRAPHIACTVHPRPYRCTDCLKASFAFPVSSEAFDTSLVFLSNTAGLFAC